MDYENLPCAEKLVFDSEAEALGSAVTLKWRHGGDLKAYRCSHCNLWHLSSN